MRDLSIIIAFLAIILAACGTNEADSPCDAGDTEVIDAEQTDHVSVDCKDLCAKKGLDGDECIAYCASERKKGVCYEACKGSAGYCKKVCYGKSDTKDAGSSLPEDATSTKLPEDATSTK